LPPSNKPPKWASSPPQLRLQPPPRPCLPCP
jgi:hypothetical protein